MKWIKLFEDFNKTDDETLYIFDFDDTLVQTPDFDDLAIEFLTESVTIPELIDKSLKWISKQKSDLKVENGRIYVEDPQNLIQVKANWVRKGNRVYMVTPNGFFNSDISLPTGTKELAELYKKVKNKAIVTGRSKQFQYQVEDSLKKFGLEMPNCGLFCFPFLKQERIAEWKAETIVNLLKETGFKKAYFYDDRSKWVNKAVDRVKKELPQVDFRGIKVN